ncbi:uncharacterized protein LOC101854990 [Aplysia californica]|uniref:Uncharacterized protein LOC101854990 n=1 Tax=Aplysia californica TaxID=6500 RepID=A0ABM0ZWS0_APLCA|nr:uncharacterized protein LOC101854990 [Aplysia californica]
MQWGCLFLVCAAFVTVESTVERRSRSCRYLQRCLDSYNSFPDPTSPAVLTNMSTSGGIAGFCQATRPLPRCVVSRVRRCHHSRTANKARVAASVTMYLCRPSTRAELVHLSEILQAGSTCLDNPAVEGQIDAEVDGCMAELDRANDDLMIEIELGLKTLEDMCPLTQELVWCSVAAFAVHCHPLLVDFFDGVLSHALEAATYQIGCSLEGTRHTRDVLAETKDLLKRMK